MDSPTYSIGEFARLAGVTRRTLHYYDEAGLLKPFRQAANGRRRYRKDDLLRLQQIVTLKYMGFSLADIERLLTSPGYDLKASLILQREAISRQIQQLQGAYYALSQTLNALDTNASIHWESVTAVIHQLTDEGKQLWLKQYFSADAIEVLRDRAAYAAPEVIHEGTQAWITLYAAFNAVSHLDPADAVVQGLAARMADLIQQFTGGNTAIDAGLEQAYANLPTAEFQSLQTFMSAALTVYRTKKERT